MEQEGEGELDGFAVTPDIKEGSGGGRTRVGRGHEVLRGAKNTVG